MEKRGSIDSEEVRQLWKTYTKTRSQEARDALVTVYTPFVRSTVKKYAKGSSPEDLYQSGLLGLLEGIQDHDPNTRAHPLAYIKIRIRGAILDELYKTRFYGNSKLVGKVVYESEMQKKGMGGIENLVPTETLPGEELERKEELEHLLRKLPTRERVLIIERDILQMPLSEIQIPSLRREGALLDLGSKARLYANTIEKLRRYAQAS